SPFQGRNREEAEPRRWSIGLAQSSARFGNGDEGILAGRGDLHHRSPSREGDIYPASNADRPGNSPRQTCCHKDVDGAKRSPPNKARRSQGTDPMAHQLEVVDGKASLFFVGELPWHGLGQELHGRPTVAEAIAASGLDWDVELVPLVTQDTCDPA